MEKVFALCRRNLLGRKRDYCTSYRTLFIYADEKRANEKCLQFRQDALSKGDDTVDYCVVEYNLL